MGLLGCENMSCADFERRLQLLLDQRRDPLDDAALASHASRCDDCAERLEAQQLLFGVLAEAAAPWREPPAVDVGATRGGRGTARRRRPQWLGMGSLALVSTALLALILVFGGRARTAPDRVGGEAVATNEAITEPARERVVNRERQVGRERPSRRASMGVGMFSAANPGRLQRIVASVADGARIGGEERVAGDPQLERIEQLARNVDNELLSAMYDSLCKSPRLPESSIPQVENLADELRPVAEPFLGVVNVLLRAGRKSGGESYPPMGMFYQPPTTWRV